MVSRRSRSAFLFLPFLLPALTAATALSDFESLPSTITLQSCITEYKAPISNCQPGDFQNGSQCSPDCVIGLYVKATSIANACANVVTSDSSLLAIAFHGQLAPKLCKNLVDGSVSSMPSSGASTPTSTKTTPSTTSPSTTSSSNNQPSTSSTTSLSSSSRASSASTLSTTTIASSSSHESGSIVHATGPAPTSLFSGTPTFTGATQPASARLGPTGSSNGGGSPFEFSGADRSRASVSMASMMIALGWGLLLLLR